MPTMNAKNMMLSPAASDLGLGSVLQQQKDDQVAEQEAEAQKKKKAALMNNTLGAPSMSMAAGTLFGM